VSQSKTASDRPVKAENLVAEAKDFYRSRMQQLLKGRKTVFEEKELLAKHHKFKQDAMDHFQQQLTKDSLEFFYSSFNKVWIKTMQFLLNSRVI